MSERAVSAFDALYRSSDDPWLTHTRWYEERKRTLVMAALPDKHFVDAYEAGCGNGNLSSRLAARCDRVDASDASLEALRVARASAAPAHVRFLQHRLPDDWPTRSYDLIVLSEVVYFLMPDEIDAVATRICDRIRPSDVVLACDWRAPIDGRPLSGDEAHRRLGDRLNLPLLGEYVDADVIVSVWSPDVRSVATREGIR